MADTYDAEGRLLSTTAKKSKADIESAQATAKFQDARGLGAAAAAAKKTAPAGEETDESKMSPLALMAYRAKKKREAQAKTVEK